MMDRACLHIPTERVGIAIVSDCANSAYETFLYLFVDIVAEAKLKLPSVKKGVFEVQMIRD